MSSAPQTPQNQSTSPAEATPDPRRWGVLAAMGLGTLMGTLDMSVVNVSLPTLVEDLDTDFATIQWVILSYALVITSLMLGAGRLGDMYGKKKLYLWGMAIFVAGSLLSGISPSVGWLIAFRAVQGFGAVVIQALGAAIITEVFPASERGRALGIIGSVVAVGLSMGPAIGGILIGTVGWRSIFLINVPVGLLSGLAVVRLVPRAKRVNNGESYDSAGAILLMMTLSAYALGMTSGQVRGFTDPAVLWLLGASGLGLAMFLFMENRLRHPMLELTLFKDLEFSLSLLLGLMLFIIHASNFIIPFYLQLVLGYSTEKVGLLMMVAPLTMGLISPVSGALSDRFWHQGHIHAGAGHGLRGVRGPVRPARARRGDGVRAAHDALRGGHGPVPLAQQQRHHGRGPGGAAGGGLGAPGPVAHPGHDQRHPPDGGHLQPARDGRLARRHRRPDLRGPPFGPGGRH